MSDATRGDGASSDLGVAPTVSDDAPKPARGWSEPTVDLGGAKVPPRRAVTQQTERTPFDPGDGRFERRGELGRGGMGWVEDAFDGTLGRAVAIKHLLRGSDHDLARFAREARITARLEHPGIVPIYEAGRDADGAPYYVMRRVDGKPLAQIVDKATLAERLALIPNLLAACDAIAFAHARGVVHRDIKPTNILLGPFGETLVIDWGLAREIDPDAAASGTAIPVSNDLHTVAGTIAGTPGFMAPEQARGEPVDARADVFALGATLFYVLGGKPLYDSATPTEMVNLAGAGHAPNWIAMPERVPPDLRAILDKALANDPDRRYPDAAALAADLRRFVTGNLVGAYDYGVLARLSRFARRHRAAVGVATASALVLAAIAVVSVRRVVAERDHADAARAIAEARQREARDAADDLLVQRALQLTQTDPVGAIKLLRRLDASSTRWRDAWLAAAAAWTRGIPFEFHGSAAATSAQLSADGRRAVVASDGHIEICDLAAYTIRTVDIASPVLECQWITDHHVLCMDSETELVLVDTDRTTTRDLGLRAAVVVSDRHSRALIQTRDRDLVEVTAADPSPRVLAKDVSIAGVAPDLDEAALWHGDDLELWTPARVTPVAHFDASTRKASSGVELRDHAIVGVFGAELRRWRVDGDHVTDDGRWPRTDELQLFLVGSDVYGYGASGLRIVGAATHDSTEHPSVALATAGGLVTFAQDGTIGLLGREGWIELGPYPANFVRADLAPDGKRLIAVTDAGDVLAWDLDAFRAHATYLEASEEPMRLAPPALWTRDLPRGVVRRTLGTDDRTVVLPGGISPEELVAVAPDSRWAVLEDRGAGKLAVYDATSGVHGSLGGAVAVALADDGIALVKRDATLGWWQPGTTSINRIGELPAPPAIFAIQRHVVVAEFEPTRLSRIDLDSGRRVDADLHEPVTGLAFAADGRAWLVTARGALWRWDAGGSPVHVDMPEPVTRVVAASGHVLATGSRSLIVLDGVAPRAIPIEARAIGLMGSDYAACLSPHGVVSVVDLDTGTSFALRGAAVTGALVANGDTLMYATEIVDRGVRYDALELRVPHAPAELRKWLADVTNGAP